MKPRCEFMAVLIGLAFGGTMFAQHDDAVPTNQVSGLPGGAVFRLGTTSFRAGGEPDCMVCSPDGSLLAFLPGDDHWSVVVMDVRTGRIVHRRTYHPWGVSALAFSPEGATLAIGTTDGKVELWNLANGEVSQFVDTEREILISSVCFSPNGKFLALASYERFVEVWDIPNRREVAQLKDRGPIKSLRFFANGAKLLVSYQTWDYVRIWEWRSKQQPRQVQATDSMASASPDGTSLAIAEDEANIAIYDAATLKRVQLMQGIAEPPRLLEFVTDDLIAAGGIRGELAIWDRRTGHKMRAIRAHADRVSSLLVAPDGKNLFTSGEAGTIRIWDVETLEQRTVPRPEDHQDRIYAVAFTPAGDQIASASDDVVRLWDLRTGTLVRGIPTAAGSNTAVAFSPDGRAMAVVGSDHRVRLFNPVDGGLVRELESEAIGTLANPRVACEWPQSDALAYSPDGTQIAAVVQQGKYGDYFIVIWDATSGRFVRQLTIFRAPELIESPGSIRFSRDGNCLAVAGRFGVYLIDARSGAELFRRQFEDDTYPNSRLCLSSDGHQMAVGSCENEDLNWQIELWKLASGNIAFAMSATYSVARSA